MIEVVKAGLYDTIQDLGRNFYQQYGIPYSGVMDRTSAKIANGLLGNETDAAVLEFTLMAPKLKFHESTSICISGAECHAAVNGKSIKNNQVVNIKQGDLLSFSRCAKGFRGYVAVKGGFLTQKIMGSRSQYKGITETHRLVKGDKLQIVSKSEYYESGAEISRLRLDHFDSGFIEVMLGREFDYLPVEIQYQLFEQVFTVSSFSNRMAYQCDESIANSLKPIITSLILPGTVQLTPSGQLMILMQDCQVTGGYPRILQLSEDSIDKLSQKRIGSKFQFKRI
ncbi:MAG: biotin-dependent carboxyltransferase family protein [Bacteroidota bacterium]